MINAKNATYFFENIKINDSYRNRILVFCNTPYDLMRTPTTLKWVITHQPLPERKTFIEFFENNIINSLRKSRFIFSGGSYKKYKNLIDE